MATSQGQDIRRCKLCPERRPVEHHCNLCHVNLCFNCILTHISDKTKRHEIVDFINKKEELILPECKSHDKLCEVYCNDCHEPACVLCVTTTHKMHDITDIKIVIEDFQRRIAADVEELETTIHPNYKKIFGNSSEEFDKVMDAIQDQEDNMCKLVREIGSQLKDEVAQQKREYKRKKKEVKSFSTKEETELNAVIETNKRILKSKDARRILTYQLKIESFRRGPKQMQISYPVFFSGKASKNQLQEMFGSLQRSIFLANERKLGMQKLLTDPVLLSSFFSPYPDDAYLIRVLSESPGKIWISGDDCQIFQLDQNGLILKTISVSNNAIALSLSLDKELVFSVSGSDTNVYKYDGDVVSTLVDLRQWYPRGLCHSANGDLLVSMRSEDETESRVVRYLGTNKTMVIQNDSQGYPLFSVGVSEMLLLAENGNGDICVADYDGNAVVVVNATAELRFKYWGNISSKPNYGTFKPLQIATDVCQQILIVDFSSDILHVIDRDGKFLRYIEYPCYAGLSIDTDNILLAGDSINGTIQFIRYLQ